MNTLHMTREQGIAVSRYIQALLHAGNLPDLMQIEQEKSSPKKNPPVTVRVLNGNNQLLHAAMFNQSGGRLL